MQAIPLHRCYVVLEQAFAYIVKCQFIQTTLAIFQPPLPDCARIWLNSGSYHVWSKMLGVDLMRAVITYNAADQDLAKFLNRQLSGVPIIRFTRSALVDITWQELDGLIFQRAKRA